MAGRNPIFTSVYPNLASGTASVKSHSVAMPQPPASAAPFTAAISGLLKLQMRRKMRAMRRESSIFSWGDWRAMAESISRSMPALKALPMPVRMPTRAVTFFDDVERGLQLGEHLRGDSVALFWTIEREGGQFAGKFQF